MGFNKEEKKTLLKIARDTILARLENKTAPEFSVKARNYNLHAGAFVTLHLKTGELRGCIGQMFSEEPLYKTVIEMAQEAAFDDPRFTPVTPAEMKELKIEISVLSPLQRIPTADKIKLGTHGVLVKKGPYSGVFLPQVAVETGWGLEEFMNNLCAGKAGLREDAWKDKNTELYVFTVAIISE